MSADARLVASPAGPLRLRAETGADASFLFQLFAESAGALLRLGGVPDATAAPLVAVQHRARTSAYRTAYPDGRFLVVEIDGAPAGRLVEADEAGGVYVVDIALLARWRSRGLGRALIFDIQTRQAAVGGAVRARAALHNAASLRMFGSLGFRGVAAEDGADVELTWTSGADFAS